MPNSDERPFLPICPDDFPSWYTIRSGDTMFALARRFNTTVSALTAANPHVPDPARLNPGDVICIPVRLAVIDVDCPPDFPGRYVVQPGDTMAAIARRFNVSVSVLIAANPQIPDPSLLMPADIICVPNPRPGDTGIQITKRTLEAPNTEIAYPEVLGLPDRNVAQAVNAVLKSTAARFREETLRSARDQAATAEELKEIMEKTSFWGSYEVTLMKDGVLSVVFHQNSYLERAAHPNTYQASVTISLRDGRVYTLDDLFKPGADYKPVLNDFMRADIARRDIPLLNDFGGVQRNQGFYLTDSALVLYYQTYEYTPYVYGVLEFRIPYGVLDGIRR